MNVRWLIAVSITLVGLAVLTAGGFVDGPVRETAEAPLEINGFVVDVPRRLPEFSLIDGEGNAFQSGDFRGYWSFVYFGYTYCPDVCPMSLVEMAKVKRSLENDQRIDNDRYYLVSVDPGRDTPERIGEYVRYFDPSFRGLTGDAEEIDKFVAAAGAIYELPETIENDNYLVGHSSFITLLNPDGNVHAFFTTDLDGDKLAADFRSILERAESR